MKKPFYQFLILVSLSINLTFFAFIVTFEVKKCPVDHDAEQTTIQEMDLLYNEALETIRKYETTEQAIMDLGASQEQAQAIIQSSELYNLDPKH